jgi:uncharacterized membrane protein YeaQ/YmgE (transglycosylase-associated protein family)
MIRRGHGWSDERAGGGGGAGVTITGILIPVVVGVVVGLVVRALLLRRAAIAGMSALLLGVVFAFVGSVVAGLLGLDRTAGIDWSAVIIQIVFAAVAVVLWALLARRRRRGSEAVARVPPIDRRPTWQPPARAASVEPAPTPSRSRPAPVAEPVPSRTRIFVSYRRSDSRHAAGRIAAALRDRFGRPEVFVDVDSLDPGANFVDGVRGAIRLSAVVLVIIGDGWLAAEDQSRRRIDDPDDTVRIEVEEALQQGCAVLPVLLDGAPMPRRDQLPSSIETLQQLHAVVVNHISWEDDIERLFRAVDGLRG